MLKLQFLEKLIMVLKAQINRATVPRDTILRTFIDTMLP